MAPPENTSLYEDYDIAAGTIDFPEPMGKKRVHYLVSKAHPRVILFFLIELYMGFLHFFSRAPVIETKAAFRNAVSNAQLTNKGTYKVGGLKGGGWGERTLMLAVQRNRRQVSCA